MSDFDGNFMEPVSYWAPPSSPSPRAILAMLNQSENDVNPMSEMFPQTNFSRDQTEQRSGLGERLAARIGFKPPTLDTGNITSPFAAFFTNSSIVPPPFMAISPGFSPSVMLQSPQHMCSDSSQITPPSLVTNNGPPLEKVESYGEGQATKTTLDSDVPHQPLQVDHLPPQEGIDDIPTEESVYIPSHLGSNDAPIANSFESELLDETNIISMEEESESESDDEDEEEEDDDDEESDAEPSSPKRRKCNVSSTNVGATRTSKQQRVIIQMECEENNPDDGFRWRKYGQKVVKGNPNPRSYYKCTVIGCKVKKHVERGADDGELVVITYDGRHEHAAPASRAGNSGPRNRSGSSLSQNDTDQTNPLGRPRPPSSFTTSMDKERPPLPSLGPQFDMTRLYMTGLSKLPSLPVNQNSVFMCRNDEPKIDDVMPAGTEVYNGIMHQLFHTFGC